MSDALAGRLARAVADLRTLAARQESTLAPLLRTAAAPLLAEVPLLATPPGSLSDLEVVAAHLFPECGGAAVAVRSLGT